MKIGRAEGLLFVAIVASAAAVQLYERGGPDVSQREVSHTIHTVRCAAGLDGVLLTRCEAEQDARSARHQPGSDNPRRPSGSRSDQRSRPRSLWV